MHIKPSLAMNIVQELKSIINEDLTFMDRTCHIIACTDARRIGDFHGASERMFREGINELSVLDDSDYPGTCAGINVTIEFEGEAIAVVGITGEYGHVKKYGQIIKKMTEILLLEDYLKQEKQRERNARSRFIQEWLTVDASEITETFVNKGMSLNIDIALPRRAVVLAPLKGGMVSLDQMCFDKMCIRDSSRSCRDNAFRRCFQMEL